MRFFIFLILALGNMLSLRAQGSHELPRVQDSIKQKYEAAHKALDESFSAYFYPLDAKWFALPARAYLALVDSGRTAFLHQLEGYSKLLDQAYIRDQRERIKFDFDILLTYYPEQHEIFTGRADPDLSLISSRLDENLPYFNRPELLGSAEFVAYARSWLDYRVRKEATRAPYQNRDNQWLLAAWKIIPELIHNDSCRLFWRYTYLYDHIDNDGIKDIQDIYADFKANCHDTVYFHKITGLYRDDSLGRRDHLIRVYKQVGNLSLDIHIFLPDSMAPQTMHPAIIYFHGGSWSEGKPDWFFYSCRSDARNGWVSCAVEYRLYGRHGATPFEAVKDARSAIRWLRQHSREYGIDPNRIVASGNSAGGQLVLAMALADRRNELTDDLSYSPIPNLLLVNSGVFDLTSPSWFNKRAKDSLLMKQISPTFLVRKGMPPTLIIHGTDDGNVPYATAQAFAAAMTQMGNAFEFQTIAGAQHFIWYDQRYTGKVSQFRADFLHKWGY